MNTAKSPSKPVTPSMRPESLERTDPPTSVPGPVVVTCLDVQHFKGVTAVKWEPDGELAVVSGNNGAGKSSVLDAIMSCLTSGARLPEMPIKRGYKKATCCITLGRRVVDGSDPEAAFKIERAWTPSGPSIKITNADGTPIKERPTDWLAMMFGAGGCDPLAFAQAAPAEQRATLMRVTGLDKAAVAFDAERNDALAAQRNAKAAATVHAASLAALPDTPGPDAERSMAGVLASLQEATAKNEANDAARKWLAAKRLQEQSIIADILALEERIATFRKNAEEVKKEIAGHEPTILQMRDIDLEPIRASISTIEADNAKARNRAARNAAKARLDEAEAALVAAARKIEDIDAKRRVAIEEAPMPFPGLAFSDDAVTFDRVPLGQVNTAMQMRIGVALALAEQKPIRVIFTRYGSLLDDAGMKALRDLAVEHGAQVFVERVSNGEDGGLVITDGVAIEGGAA